MKTLVRRYVACILMFAIIFLLPQSMVNAASTESKDTRPSVLYTDKNEVVCTGLVQIINTMDVTINEKTQISFASIESQPDASAIVITNTVGTLVTQNVIFTLNQDGNIEDLRAYNADVIAKSTRAGGSANHTYSGKLVIMGTAVYNIRRNQGWNYYQPVGMYFIYEKLSSCNVSYIEAEYNCCGFRYKYPEFSYEGSGNAVEDIDSHVIEVPRVTNPRENTIYDATDPLDPRYVFWVESGGPAVGQYISFEYEVDSEIRSTTCRVFHNE